MREWNAIPPEAYSYFANLPKFLQESIMQSGLTFQSREELMKFCENIRN